MLDDARDSTSDVRDMSDHGDEPQMRTAQTTVVYRPK